MSEIDGIDQEFFFSKSTGKTYYSKTFGRGEIMRFHDRVFENSLAPVFARVDKEIVLQITHSGRIQVKAVVLDESRGIKTLIIQKYGKTAGPNEYARFTFRGREIEALLDFIASIPIVPLPGETKLRLNDDELRQIRLTHGQASAIISKNPELFLKLALNEHLTRDLVAVGYRRAQLERFRALMNDEETDEATWQAFFETNTWIFGYGLSYQFLSALDGKKLEQTVRGHDLTGSGKRVDALMKTRGRISSLCFVEIKKHSTPLVSARSYRPDVWAPSSELAGGVAQVQSTVHAALEVLARTLTPRDDFGDPTGEVLYNIQPRSCLVIGSLAQFQREHGIDNAEFRSFELYRRNTTSPEIITFDELLERAQFIVEHAEQAQPEETEEDDMPF
jgi:hypothetical protein